MNIENELNTLNGWTHENNMIRKTYDFDSYMAGINFATVVASLAEDANHHPDILISYKKVTIELTTHDEGKVTSKDINLAREIDKTINGE